MSVAWVECEFLKSSMKSAEIALFSVSVATMVSLLPLLRRLNMPHAFLLYPHTD